MSSLKKVITRSGKEIKVDTSNGAFSRLEDPILNQCKSGDLVVNCNQVFQLIGVGTCDCSKTNVAWGYGENESKVTHARNGKVKKINTN
ncbi:hypothetical protein KJ603_02415 [Patescibacteria group bacterium]|nr:hypothetical protein [Patescibacteria group bacterium]